MNKKLTLGAFSLVMLFLLCRSCLGYATTPAQSLFDRQVRCVYYETETFGTQPLQITLNDLLSKGLRPGSWISDRPGVWHYSMIASAPEGAARKIVIEFRVMDEEQWRELFKDEILLTGIRIDDRDLSKPEIWSVILPIALEVRHQGQQAVSSMDREVVFRSLLQP